MAAGHLDCLRSFSFASFTCPPAVGLCVSNLSENFYSDPSCASKRFDAINAAVVYHRFDSDRLNIDYGSEWDAMVSARRGRWTGTAKLADYRANSFASDTRKVWLMLKWAY